MLCGFELYTREVLCIGGAREGGGGIGWAAVQ